MWTARPHALLAQPKAPTHAQIDAPGVASTRPGRKNGVRSADAVKSSSQRKPANDTAPANRYEPTRRYGGGDSGPLLGIDLTRAEALPEDLRKTGEALYALLDAAAAGGAVAAKQLRAVGQLLTRETPSRNAERVRVLALLEPREWRRGRVPLTYYLGRIDPAFSKLKLAQFEQARDKSIARFAARLCVAVRAFGDRDLDKTVTAFERAQREGSRKARSRAK